MKNLLKETLAKIEREGHTKNDVAFVGSKDGKLRISFEEFEKISNFEYDSGYGSQQIAEDLIVYFDEGDWLEREEYDGSEWWKIVKPLRFHKDDEYKPFTKLRGCWDSLEDINKE